MKERCKDGCRTSLLIAGVVLVPSIFHTLLSPCHPYITIHFMEMIFSTCIIINGCVICCNVCVSCIMLKYIVDLVDWCAASASLGECRYT